MAYIPFFEPQILLVVTYLIRSLAKTPPRMRHATLRKESISGMAILVIIVR